MLSNKAIVRVGAQDSFIAPKSFLAPHFGSIPMLVSLRKLMVRFPISTKYRPVTIVKVIHS